MSIFHRLDDDELSDVTTEELYSALGERDTARLFGYPYVIDVGHDVPCGAGNSIDRKTKYVDRILFQQVMDGEFRATGLEPQQIIDRWVDHEHCEKCIVDGDNPVDLYYGAHRRALKREHEGVLAVLGIKNAATKLRHYESIIWPGLERCYNRDFDKPPKDLWTGPFNDDPTERDHEILAVMQRLGVVDAFRRSKHSTGYGISGPDCDTCRHWSPQQLSQEHGTLARCEIVAGLVRDTRHCDFYKPGLDQKQRG